MTISKLQLSKVDICKPLVCRYLLCHYYARIERIPFKYSVVLNPWGVKMLYFSMCRVSKFGKKQYVYCILIRNFFSNISLKTNQIYFPPVILQLRMQPSSINTGKLFVSVTRKHIFRYLVELVFDSFFCFPSSNPYTP